MNIKLADGLPYHPTMRHPHTGNRLRAIGVLRGKPVWPVLGASEDDEGEKGKSEDKPKEGVEDNKPDEDKGEKKPEETAEAKRIRQLEEDIAKLKTHRSEADKKRSAAEVELQKIKDKDLSDVERLTKELEAAKENGVKSGKAFQTLARATAFFEGSQNLKIQWHDPKVARAAIAEELAALDIEEDGSVSGVDALLKKLAKDKPFLVDKGKAADEEDKKEKKGPSGSGVGSGNNGGKGKEELAKEDLLQRFPALRK